MFCDVETHQVVIELVQARYIHHCNSELCANETRLHSTCLILNYVRYFCPALNCTTSSTLAQAKLLFYTCSPLQNLQSRSSSFASHGHTQSLGAPAAAAGGQWAKTMQRAWPGKRASSSSPLSSLQMKCSFSAPPDRQP